VFLMGKTFEKAVAGFNHNIKHKGKVYHVQTEDSGINNPHILTHLFVGGNVLASKKTSYADILDAENLSERVRALMEGQHKEMLRNLVRGAYEQIDSAAAAATHYQPGQLATAEQVAQVKLQPGKTAAPAPPAARAANDSPKESNFAAKTIFGEDLISEKSLDEVILSYLAGEGDP
jgi:hypothetical protein